MSFLNSFPENPTVSICLPVWNGQAYLDQALDSVLSQTLYDFELLIADDCSTDNSPEIIAQYAKLDKRIVWWRNDARLGLFANYNQCMERASGTYIKPFAQDDLWSSELLSKQVSLLSKHSEVALVAARRLVINEHNDTVPDQQSGLANILGKQLIYPSQRVIGACLSHSLGNPIGEPCAVMFRKSAQGLGFNTIFRHIGDLEYWLRILAHGHLGMIDEPLVFFRKHKNSTTARNVKQLWAFSDYVHLAQCRNDDLIQLGLSQDQFLKNTYTFVVAYLATLPEEALDRTALMPDDDYTPSDVAALRKALLIALSMQHGPEPVPNNSEVSDQELLANESAIAASEQRLAKLLNSPSWRVTRPLREVNKLVSPGLITNLNLNERVSIGSPIDRQRAYLRYLKDEEKAILDSRSWRISGFIRKAVVADDDNASIFRSTSVEVGCRVDFTQENVQSTLVPDISVIIPIYNGKRFLKLAIESVLAQTLPPKELILVDDGSTDGSLESVDDLRFPFPVIRKRQENAGQAAARNLGVQLASGDFLAFLDQDDSWYPEHLLCLRKMFLNDPHSRLGWVYSNFDEVDRDGRMITRNHLDFLPFEHPKRNLVKMLGEDMHVLPSASLIRTSAFREVGGFDENFCGYEDDDLFLRIFLLGYGNEYLNEALSQWRIYSESTCYANPRMDTSLVRYMQKLAALFPDDVRQYTRDCIVPRFVHAMLARYDRALNKYDEKRADSILKELLSAFPDQPSSSLWYSTRIILPRLLDHIIHRYNEAAEVGDSPTMRLLRLHMNSLAKLDPSTAAIVESRFELGAREMLLPTA